MAEIHDKTHRLLFSFPRMVEELIRLCLSGEWMERLDFSTLEKVPERLLSKDLVRREQDVLWRVRYIPPEPDESAWDDEPEEVAEPEDNWFYVYVQVEHERKGRPFMPLDALFYKLLTWQDMVRQKILTPSGKLSPILTLVFYNGDRPASMKKSLSEMIERIPGAPAELFDPTYIVVVDGAHGPLPDSGEEPSPLVSLMRLERLEALEELFEVSEELSGMLRDPEDLELREAFVALINASVLPRLLPPDTEEGERLRITDLEEIVSMLEQRIDHITQRWEYQGWQRGQEEGRREEAARLLLTLLAERFGGELPAWVHSRVEAATTLELEIWVRRVLQAESLEDVFAD